jgi:hypothetical protein
LFFNAKARFTLNCLCSSRYNIYLNPITLV